MTKRPTPPRLGFRVPPPPPPRDALSEDDTGLREGDLIDGRYQIEGQVGEGGAGVVYRALQLKLHRRVAIKLLQQESQDDQKPRFEREAVTLAALSHPNIVSVQDYGHTRGRPFLVMELLEGRTLREIIDNEGALSVPRTLSFMRQMLHALAYAHGLGIVHRDLKPANLLVQSLPAFEHVKVLDFGFVKLLPGSYLDRGVQLSRVGFTFGTPAYMSPEHATGGDVDGRSDLYSMGILMFEMLTGVKPFEGELPDLIRHHLSTAIPRLWERNPALAGRTDLQAVIDRSMAKLRDARFADAAELLRALDTLAGQGSSTTSGGQANIGTMPVPAPSAGLDVELKRLSAAVQHFARIVYATAKHRSGPMLKGASARLGALLLKIWTVLQAWIVASWAWAEPHMLKLQQKISPKSSEPKGVEPKGAVDEVDPGHAATIDLSDSRVQAELVAKSMPPPTPPAASVAPSERKEGGVVEEKRR